MPISTPVAPTTVVNSSANSLTVTSGSFTPTGNSLIVAMCCARDPAGGYTFTNFTSTFSEGGWTTVNSTPGEYGTGNGSVIAGWCIADASPGAGTVTATFATVNPDRLTLYLFEIDSGFDTTTPVLQFKVDGQAGSGTSFTSDFDATPASGSVLLAVGMGINATPVDPTPDTNWTELEANVNSNMNTNSQYVAGSNGTSIGISFGATSQTDGITITALEIQEPAASGSVAGINTGLIY